MVGTKLSFNLDDVDIKKTARMGGLVQDAFTILWVHAIIMCCYSYYTFHTHKYRSVFSPCSLIIICHYTIGRTKDGDKYLFSAVLKDRKKIIQTLTTAIANVKLEKEEKTFDEATSNDNKKKKTKKFRMPPDETLGKMNIIAETKLKGVSLDDYVEVAVRLYVYF